MNSFLLPIKLGQPISRPMPGDILPYVESDEWHAFCDAFDRISMNWIDRNANILMRLFLMIAILCLVIVVLFGYMESDDDNENSEDENDDGGVSTLLVLSTAVPICFPFVMAAVLNCHSAATVAKLLNLSRTCCEKWASANALKVTVEQLQSVSDTDEVIDKILVQFGPTTPSKVLEVDSGAPPETSPDVNSNETCQQ